MNMNIIILSSSSLRWSDWKQQLGFLKLICLCKQDWIFFFGFKFTSYFVWTWSVRRFQNICGVWRSEPDRLSVDPASGSDKPLREGCWLAQSSLSTAVSMVTDEEQQVKRMRKSGGGDFHWTNCCSATYRPYTYRVDLCSMCSGDHTGHTHNNSSTNHRTAGRNINIEMYTVWWKNE